MAKVLKWPKPRWCCSFLAELERQSHTGRLCERTSGFDMHIRAWYPSILVLSHAPYKHTHARTRTHTSRLRHTQSILGRVIWIVTLVSVIKWCQQTTVFIAIKLTGGSGLLWCVCSCYTTAPAGLLCTNRKSRFFFPCGTTENICCY